MRCVHPKQKKIPVFHKLHFYRAIHRHGSCDNSYDRGGNNRTPNSRANNNYNDKACTNSCRTTSNNKDSHKISSNRYMDIPTSSLNSSPGNNSCHSNRKYNSRYRTCATLLHNPRHNTNLRRSNHKQVYLLPRLHNKRLPEPLDRIL